MHLSFPAAPTRRRCFLGTAVGLLSSATAAFGQATSAQRAPEPPITASRLPAHLQPYLKPVASRIAVVGKERASYAGTVDAAGVREPISWTAEFPGRLRLLRGAAGRALTFDLQGVGRALDDLDEELLESLSADTADTFLDKVRQGYEPRMLGSRFRVPGAVGFGAEMDIFEMALPVAARREATTAVKHFGFDSATGLLREVAYHRVLGASRIRHATRYSNYENVDGTPLSKQIERFQGAQRRFQINVASSALQAAALDGLFNTGR